MEGKDLIEYFKINDIKENNEEQFISIIVPFLDNWYKEAQKDIKFDTLNYVNENFNNILSSAEKISKDIIPYSEVTTAVFNMSKEGEVIVDLIPILKEKIFSEVKQKYFDEEVPDSYLILLKVCEHINLAVKQYKILTQEDDIKETRNEINNIKETQIKINDSSNKLINDYSDITNRYSEIADKYSEIADKYSEITKTHVSLSKKYSKLAEKYSKITIDFVTILGIFTSITFATFGGLQLLGNVFGNIKSISNQSVGFEIMLGATFLFGIYFILNLLLKGISYLQGNKFSLDLRSKILAISSLVIIFIVGLLLSNSTYILDSFSSGYDYNILNMSRFLLLSLIIIIISITLMTVLFLFLKITDDKKTKR